MFETLADRLEDAIARGGYLNGGVCLIDADGRVQCHVTGQVHPPSMKNADAPLADPGLRMRMASISKAVTARVACELAVEGTLSLDAEVRELLRWKTAPRPLEGVTVRMLLNHTSGLTDNAGYIPEPPLGVTEFVEQRAAGIGGGTTPGAWFRYANLNYILLGAVLETVGSARLDELTRTHVLRPAGIGGGFNWAGVNAVQRSARLPIYQREGTRLLRQTEPDDADWNGDIVWTDGRGFSFDTYRSGRDTALLSPHAGIRLNVVEAARLARFLGARSPAGDLQRRTTWAFDPVHPNGSDCDGLFGEFGLGLMIYRNDPRIPGRLIGHSGHALGFSGGVWFEEDREHAVAIFLTGSADMTEGRDEEVFFSGPELQLMQAI